MPPKKKGKGKGKEKKKEQKPPKLTRTEWLAKIAEHNAQLAAARKRIKEIEDAYFDAEKRYEDIQEELTDISLFLRHENEQGEAEIAEYDEQIANIKKDIKKLEEHDAPIFQKAEAEYEAKHKEFENKIQVKEAKLSAYEEIRQHREDYLKRKEEMTRKLQEMEALHEKELYEADKAAIIKQDRMQKQMDTNLIKLAADFRQATDIAIGQTTNKLIKDNIALGNMLTCMQKIIVQVSKDCQRAQDTEKNYKFNAELLEEEYNFIQHKHEQEVSFIETLLKTVEELNEKIKFSRRLTKENRKIQRQIAEKDCIIKDKRNELKDTHALVKESQDKYDVVKAHSTAVKRGVIKLEIALFEATKAVKEGIEAQNLSHVIKEDGTIALEMPKEELEEALIEFKYKTRERAIDLAIEKLTGGLLTESELQLTTQYGDHVSMNLSTESKLSATSKVDGKDNVSKGSAN